MSLNTKGHFITLEGIDGAGKSSHIETIVQWLSQHGFKVINTREPGGTGLGETLRELILHQPMQPMTELLLVFAARAEHVNTVIAPALREGHCVVSDRFTDATSAYQGAGRDMGQALIRQLATMVHEHCQPDLTFIFDIDPVSAALRVQGRGASDRFESEQAIFSQKVRQQYLEIAAQDPKRCVVINGALPIEVVRQDVLKALNERFKPLHTRV